MSKKGQTFGQTMGRPWAINNNVNNDNNNINLFINNKENKNQNNFNLFEEGDAVSQFLKTKGINSLEEYSKLDNKMQEDLIEEWFWKRR